MADQQRFNLTAVDVPDGVRLELSGDLDLTQLDIVDTALSYLGSTAHTLILDLAGPEFCDSAGLHIRVKIRDSTIGARRQFRIVNVRPNVRRIFDNTGIAGHLNVIDHDPQSSG